MPFTNCLAMFFNTSLISAWSEKLKSIDKYCKDSIQYVGIAYDEKTRLERLHNERNKISPLEEWKYTEKDCLDYCYSKGYDWYGLYNYLDRVSCWCCRNKNIKELKNYYKYLPDYFNRLVILEKVIGEPMKKPYYLTERKKQWEQNANQSKKSES